MILTVQGVSTFRPKWMPTEIAKEELLMEQNCSSYTQRMSSELKFHK